MKIFGKIKSEITDSHKSVVTYENGVVVRDLVTSNTQEILMPNGRKIIHYPEMANRVDFYYNPKSPKDHLKFYGTDVIVYPDLTVEAHPKITWWEDVGESFHSLHASDEYIGFDDVNLISPSRNETVTQNRNIIHNVFSITMKGPQYENKDSIYFVTARSKNRDVNIVTFDTQKYYPVSVVADDDLDEAFENWVDAQIQFRKLKNLNRESGRLDNKMMKVWNYIIEKRDILDDMIKEKIMSVSVFIDSNEESTFKPIEDEPTEQMPINEPDEEDWPVSYDNPTYEPTESDIDSSDTETDIDSDIDFPEEKL